MSTEIRLVQGSKFVEFTAEDGKPGFTHVESDRGVCLVMDDAQAEVCIANLRRDGWEEE